MARIYTLIYTRSQRNLEQRDNLKISYDGTDSFLLF